VGEVPLLKELYEQYKDQGVVVVGVSLDEDVKLVQEMVASKGITWTQISDADKRVRKLYNVKGTPSYYVLDRDGKIVGKDLPSFKRLKAAIDDLLKTLNKDELHNREINRCWASHLARVSCLPASLAEGITRARFRGRIIESSVGRNRQTDPQGRV
jgi:hypothetical protein